MNTMEEYMRTKMLMDRRGKSVMSDVSKLYQEISDLRMLNAELAQRKEWVGLTDEEISGVWNATPHTHLKTFYMFAKDIEAKLKEKNGG